MKDGICPKCRAQNVIGNLKQNVGPGYPGHDYGVRLGGLFTGTSLQADIRAWVCCDCGYTEFYTKTAKRLGELIDKASTDTRQLADGPVRVSSPDKTSATD